MSQADAFEIIGLFFFGAAAGILGLAIAIVTPRLLRGSGRVDSAAPKTLPK